MYSLYSTVGPKKIVQARCHLLSCAVGGDWETGSGVGAGRQYLGYSRSRSRSH
jgi:hypothetical protein